MITKENLINWWNTYKHELNYDKMKSPKRPMYQKIEAEFLFSALRELKPSKIIELGPHAGWTTQIILSATRLNKTSSKLYSSDLLDLSRTLDCDGTISRELIIGDSQKTITNEIIKDCDFLFVDSKHTEAFAKWYCQKIISKLPSNTLVFIHDWEGSEGNKDPEPQGVLKYGVEPKILTRLINVMDYVLENKLSTSINPRYAKGDRSPTEICVTN